MTDNLSDYFAEEEARRLAQGRAEIAAEKAAWNALTPEEQQAQLDRIEAKYEGIREEATDPEYDEDQSEDEEDDE